MERSGKLDWFRCAAAQLRCRPREIGARTEVEEALRPLYGHRTVTGARIVQIDLVDKALRPLHLSRPTSQPPTKVGPNKQGEYSFFLCVITRHFRWVRADSGGNVFFAKYGDPSCGSQQSGGNVFFAK